MLLSSRLGVLSYLDKVHLEKTKPKPQTPHPYSAQIPKITYLLSTFPSGFIFVSLFLQVFPPSFSPKLDSSVQLSEPKGRIP